MMPLRRPLIALLLLTACTTLTPTGSFTPPERPDGVIRKVMAHGLKPHFSRSYGVIIGANAELHHQGNMSLAYQVMVEHGIRPRDIFILDSNSEVPYFPKTDTSSVLAASTLFEGLRSIVSDQDALVVYVTGHGVMRQGVPMLQLAPGQELPMAELARMVDAVRPSVGLAVFDECYHDIRYRPMGCVWTTVTAAAPGLVTGGDTFPRAFWGSLRGTQGGEADIKQAVEDGRRASLKTSDAPALVQRTCGPPNEFD